MRTSLLLIPMFTSLLACSEVVDPLEDASVSLRWELPPMDCARAEISEVRVVLESLDARVARVVPCAPGVTTVSELTPGAWTLVLEGLDAAGVSRMISARASVLLPPGLRDDLAPYRLSPSPAQLDVSWSFDNGLLCGSNHVEDVDVTVFDVVGHELARAAFPCELGAGSLNDVPAGAHLLHVAGRSVEGGVFEAVVEMDVERGARHDVSAQMASPIP